VANRPLFEHPREEPLRQILGVIRAPPLDSKIGVQRIPVAFARLASASSAPTSDAPAPRSEHQAPARRRKVPPVPIKRHARVPGKYIFTPI